MNKKNLFLNIIFVVSSLEFYSADSESGLLRKTEREVVRRDENSAALGIRQNQRNDDLDNFTGEDPCLAFVKVNSQEVTPITNSPRRGLERREKVAFCGDGNFVPLSSIQNMNQQADHHLDGSLGQPVVDRENPTPVENSAEENPLPDEIEREDIGDTGDIDLRHDAEKLQRNGPFFQLTKEEPLVMANSDVLFVVMDNQRRLHLLEEDKERSISRSSLLWSPTPQAPSEYSPFNNNQNDDEGEGFTRDSASPVAAILRDQAGSRLDGVDNNVGTVLNGVEQY